MISLWQAWLSASGESRSKREIATAMFVLAQMKDTVRIPPSKLHLDTTQTIIGILNKKFANKVKRVGRLALLFETKLECRPSHIQFFLLLRIALSEPN